MTPVKHEVCFPLHENVSAVLPHVVLIRGVVAAGERTDLSVVGLHNAWDTHTAANLDG